MYIIPLARTNARDKWRSCRGNAGMRSASPEETTPAIGPWGREAVRWASPLVRCGRNRGAARAVPRPGARAAPRDTRCAAVLDDCSDIPAASGGGRRRPACAGGWVVSGACPSVARGFGRAGLADPDG